MNTPKMCGYVNCYVKGIAGVSPGKAGVTDLAPASNFSNNLHINA